MKQTWTITLLQPEQPGDKIWRALVRQVKRWNESRTPKFSSAAEFMWQVNFDATTRPEMEQLRAQLEELKRTQGAAYHLSSRSLIEEGDYHEADFIEILGVGLGSESRPFLVNHATAFGPPAPCPKCGSQEAFSTPQREAFVIDEKQLGQANTSGEAAPADGWDFVNLDNGQKLISKRFADFLDEHHVDGYDLVEVIDRATQQPSHRMFQITAQRAIVSPCPEHTKMESGSFCPICGTSHGVLQGWFWIRSDWIGDDEVVSCHPNRGAMLYVSRRVYDSLLETKLNGIHRNDVLRVCPHSETDR